MGKMAAGVAFIDGHDDFTNIQREFHIVIAEDTFIQDEWAQESPSIVLAEDPFEMDRPPVDVGRPCLVIPHQFVPVEVQITCANE